MIMVQFLPELSLLLSLISPNSLTKLQTVTDKFIINVCHKIYGHVCCGSYIRRNWVLITYECSWDRRDQKFIELVAENPNLDCVHGQSRQPKKLYLPRRKYLDTNHRIALVTFTEPFVMGTASVALIPIHETVTNHDACVMYEYYYDDVLSDFALKSHGIRFWHVSHCRDFFPYDYKYATKGISCAETMDQFSLPETVALRGLSPVVCDNKLKGYVIAANRTTLVVMTIEFQYDWIISKLKTLLDKNKCPRLKINLENGILLLIGAYVCFILTRSLIK